MLTNKTIKVVSWQYNNILNITLYNPSILDEIQPQWDPIVTEVPNKLSIDKLYEYIKIQRLIKPE